MTVRKLNQPGAPCCCAIAAERLLGKCYKLTLHTNPGVDPPECCETVDEMDIYLPIFGTGCNFVGNTGFADYPGCNWVNAQGGIVFFDCDHPYGYSFGFVLSIAAGEVYGHGHFTPGGLVHGDEGCREAYAAAITQLIGGATVTLEFAPASVWGEDPPCGLDGATLTVEIVGDGGDCEGIPYDPDASMDCTELDTCANFPLMIAEPSGFEDCEIPDDGDTHPYLEERFYSWMNRHFVCDQSDRIDGDIYCISEDKYGFYSRIVPVDGLDSEQRRANPGVLHRLETTEELSQLQVYAVAIAVKTECISDYSEPDNRRWIVSEFHPVLHSWLMLWDGTGYNIPTAYSLLFCESYSYDDALPYKGAEPFACWPLGGAYSGFEYDKCGSAEPFRVDFYPANTAGVDE